MNLNKHQAVRFLECTTNNILFNLGFTIVVFLLCAKAPGLVLIPCLLFLNAVWVCLYGFLSFTENRNFLVITDRGKRLLIHLTVFFSLSCAFWHPEASRKLFVISILLLNIIILVLHLFRKPLRKIIATGLQRADKNLYHSGIISGLKSIIGNDVYMDHYHPSFNVVEGSKMRTIAYNSKADIHQLSRVSLNSEMEQSGTLENAEYSFNNIHFGDTLAGWAVNLPQKNRYEGTELRVRQLNNRILKRAFDIFISSFVVVFFLSWMVPLIGLLIKLESKGPIFFKQLRSGLNNQPFWCYKFRSMHVNEQSDELQATRGDSRITRIGAFLRKTSIDEFPQFINVLKGEMSIVGPRPHMLKHTEIYSARIDNYMNRLALKQGLTGWAQVKGYRGETTDIRFMEERVEMDMWYMENWSVWLDIKIIFLTVIKIFKTDESAF